MAFTERHRPYPAYKDSGVQWLGEIPTHWKVRRLKHVATWNDEALPDSTDAGLEIAYVDIGGVDAVRGIIGKETLAFHTAPSRARRIVRHGDVVISTVRTYLRAISPIIEPEGNLIVSTGFAVIRPRLIDTSFASYAMRAPYFVDHVVANSVGVSYPAINANELVSIAVVCPSEREQHAIAAFLDRETAKIDALVAKKEQLIELLQEKRTALITQAVTKGLDLDVPMKDSGVGWLGAVPANWDLLALKRRWKVVDCKHLTVPFIGEGIPLASVRETQSFELDLRDAQRTTVEWYKTLIEGGRKPRRGDLIYCRNVSVGSASLVTGDNLFAMGQDVCLIRSSTENQRWLNYFLCSSAMSSQLASTLVGSTFNRINVAEVMTLLIPVPPRVEQDHIAQFLDLETAKIDSLVAKVYEAINHLKQLRTALISAAVTGKIDVRDGAAQTPGIAS